MNQLLFFAGTLLIAITLYLHFIERKRQQREREWNEIVDGLGKAKNKYE